MQNQSWPPTIPSPVLSARDDSLIKEVGKGIASLWAACAGTMMSLGVMQNSDLFGSGSISQPFSGYFVFVFVGLVCDFSGLGFGMLGRKTTVGRIGLSLSLLALVSIPALVLAYHAHNGNWPWLTDDDCHCL